MPVVAWQSELIERPLVQPSPELGCYELPDAAAFLAPGFARGSVTTSRDVAKRNGNPPPGGARG